MIKLCSPQTCTGCEACKSVCPVNAISMQPNGNLLAEIPVIDTTACIECHACERVCPVLNPLELLKPSETFAAISTNPETNATSSSGGIGAEIARRAVENGGIAYGAVAENGQIFHKRCCSLDEIEALKGSKYVKSQLRNTYAEVRQDLKEGKSVVFFGTPCQIAGLKSFLKKPYDNLLTIDLICHGTPSQELLKRHIQTVVGENADVDRIVFREDGFHFRIYDGQGTRLYDNNVWKQKFEDAYYSAFCIGCCSFRDSCYACRYAGAERVSDITIGDFWGLNPEVKFSRRPTGVSVVLAITPKGRDFIGSMGEAIELQPRPLSEAINGNPQLRRPSKLNHKGRLFRKLLKLGFGLKRSLLLAYLPLLPIYMIKNKLNR